MPTISKLVQMKVCNLGCIGSEGLVVLLDEIVCLVGPNNCGKSTVLRAYEAAVSQAALSEQEFHGDKQDGTEGVRPLNLNSLF
jgi:putative ATP-dependent endonuclease of OLD family